VSEDFEPQQLTDIYRNRFTEQQLEDKRVLWSTLCDEVFQAYVPKDGVVLDLGAGNCEFSNAITASRRIAVDLNPDTKQHAAPGVEVLLTSSTAMSAVESGSVDTVFTSNFFEHLPSKDDLSKTLAECHRVLKPGGRIVVLMPNIRYLAGRYWDYLDHHLPLTHLSLSEGLEIAGFKVERVVPRFLPYTVKDATVPVRAWTVRTYLRLPVVWRFLGRQMLVVGVK
jgi:SAM-dependent methyltransferase